jgi:hypothetical protein
MPRRITERSLRVACAVAAALFAVYACLLAVESPSGFPPTPTTHHRWPWLGDKPVGEDGFYMLTVADNLATTHHLAYNGGLTVTGIQPLSTLVFAGIAAVVHTREAPAPAQGPVQARWTLVRAVVLFGAALALLFAWLMARFTARLVPASQRALVFSVTFLLLLFDFTAFRLFTYGLETSLYLCLLALCLGLWHRIVAHAREARRNPEPAPNRILVLFGIAAGFAGLARIDFGLIYAFLLAYLLFRRLATPLQVLLSGGIALLIVSPWFIFVHRVTGGWIPTSGTVESGFHFRGADRLVAWTLAVIAHLAPWSYAFTGNTATTAFGVLSVVSLVVLAWRSPLTRQRLGERNTGGLYHTFVPWAIAVAALTVLYAVFFQSTFFFVRYFAPLLLVSAPLLALALAEQRIIQKRPLLFFAALLLVFSAEDLATLHRASFGNPHFLAAGYLVEHFPNAHVGAYQSGIIGYVDPNVENLDGKLNQQAHLATLAGTMDNFIDHEHIDVLLDWPGYLHDTLPAGYLAEVWQPCPIAPPNPQDVCFIRKTYLAAHPEYLRAR